MPQDDGAAIVHLLAGLNGAGKTTHARRLERECPAVRFTLDEWMLRLYQRSYDDPEYPVLADRCTDLIWATAQQVLSAGVDVVLDWNLWSRSRRQVWRERVEAVGHHAVLHHLAAPIETAIQRAEHRARGASPHAHVLDASAVRHLANLFEPPDDAEGMEIRLVRK